MEAVLRVGHGDSDMSAFTKLDSGIVHSTIWIQPHDVLRAWIALLALADQHGIARTAAPALAHLCMIPLDRMREILRTLESPDEDSRSEADDGRRIVKIEGGWRLVNHAAYRARRDTDTERERKREWDRQNRPSGHARAEQSDASPTQSDASPTNPTNPPQAEAEAEAEPSKSKEQVRSRGSRLPMDWRPSGEEVQWANAKRPDLAIQEEVEHFRDYWHSKAGKDACKCDWSLTWKGWIRNARDRGGANGSGFDRGTSARNDFTSAVYVGTPDHDLPVELRGV